MNVQRSNCQKAYERISCLRLVWTYGNDFPHHIPRKSDSSAQ